IQITTTNTCGLSATSQLSVQVIPEVDEISSLVFPNNICSNEPFELEVENAQEGVEYQWTIPNTWNSQISGSTASILSSDNSGTVTVSAQNSCGSSPDFQQDITVFLAPEINFSLPENLCNNTSLELTASPTEVEFTGDGVENGIFDPSLVESSSSDITYTVTSLDNCTSSSTQSIELIASEITGGEWSTFSFPPCGGELIFEITGLENFNNWTVEVPEEWGMQTNDGSDVVGLNISDVFTDGQIIVTASNDCGTEEIFTNNVELQTAPQNPTLSAFTEAWCEGGEGEATFEVTLPDSLIVIDSSVQFELSQTGSTTSLVLFGDTGEQFITVASENICGISDETTLELTIQELPEIDFSLPGDTLCAGSDYDFLTNPPGGEIEGNGEMNGMFLGSTLDASQNYDFIYTFADNLGCSNSDSITVYLDIGPSVNERNANLLSVYPNPVTDHITVDTDLTLPLKFSVLDITGREVADSLLIYQSQNIDVHHLTTGNYNLKIGNFTQHFVVE
ncbi:MAG: T9SS type A sorting domain-containing protein, partial [Flavobacteriales bacterium]|nr:T9SS type A sorting domain-containing protein [Flavobacteriales bacterium]